MPCNRCEDHAKADWDVPEEKTVGAKEVEVNEKEPVLEFKTRPVPPRALQICKEDAEKRGRARGRAGWSRWLRDLGRQPQSEECSQRLAELMKDEARIQKVDPRAQ